MNEREPNKNMKRVEKFKRGLKKSLCILLFGNFITPLFETLFAVIPSNSNYSSGRITVTK